VYDADDAQAEWCEHVPLPLLPAISKHNHCPGSSPSHDPARYATRVEQMTTRHTTSGPPVRPASRSASAHPATSSAASGTPPLTTATKPASMPRRPACTRVTPQPLPKLDRNSKAIERPTSTSQPSQRRSGRHRPSQHWRARVLPLRRGLRHHPSRLGPVRAQLRG
jgi:hypothetical protein